MFDTSVNSGWKTSAKYLQRALNLLNRNQTSWKDIAEDGIVGPKTISVTNSLPFRDLKYLFNMMNIMQGKAYLDIATYDPTQEVFIRGWLERVELMKEVT